jgi:hypothetical protein
MPRWRLPARPSFHKPLRRGDIIITELRVREWLVQGICIVIGLICIFALCIATAEIDTHRMQERQQAAQLATRDRGNGAAGGCGTTCTLRTATATAPSGEPATAHARAGRGNGSSE